MPPTMTTAVTISITVLALSILFLSFLILKINARLKRLLRGKKAENLEDIIIRLQSEVGKLREAREISYEGLAVLDERVKRSIQHVGTVRFNPFPGTSGSNQSFATAF